MNSPGKSLVPSKASPAKSNAANAETVETVALGATPPLGMNKGLLEKALATSARNAKASSMTPAEFEANKDSARFRDSDTMVLIGAAVGLAMMLLFGFMLAGRTGLGVLIAAAIWIVLAVVILTVVAPWFARLQWQRSKPLGHTFSNHEPFVTSFLYGFVGLGLMTGVPLAILALRLFR